MIETGSAPTRKMTVKEALERYPAPRKPPASEPKRMGRPPRLSRGDYAAVEAASRDLLAVALRYYNKHAARNLKQKA
jgi:hypothetical protein